MKRFTLLISLVVISVSCKQKYTARNFDSITIKKFNIDSTSIRAINAIDANNLYYVGSKGDVGKTTDGGKTWNKQYIKYNDSIIPHFRSIASNGKVMFALSIGTPALLYQITGGNPKLVYKEEGSKVFYDSMKFIDENNGIAIGDPIDGCTSIILTFDGGQTWNKLHCSLLPKVKEGEASFAASNTNIKVYKNNIWVVTGGIRARVLKSSDKGKTWNIYDTPFIQGNGPQGIYSVDFYDENHGIIIGGNFSKPKENIANKAITSDGGKTWTLVASGKTPNYKSCVQYVPNTYGKEIFAVGITGVSFSNDGGETWKNISKDKYYSIQFVNKNTAWLSGNNKIGKLVLK